jgi:hypothetical protein
MVFESIRRRFEKPRPEDTGYEGKQVARAGAPQRDEYEVPETLRPHTTSRREKEKPRYRDEPAGRISRAKWKYGTAREKVESVRERFGEKKERKAEEKRIRREADIDIRTMKQVAERREAKTRLQLSKERHATSKDILEARAIERKAKKVEFRVKHPYATGAIQTGHRVKEHAINIGYAGAYGLGETYGEVAGRSYLTGQQQAKIVQQKAPKIKTGKTVRMIEVTPTRQDMLAPTPPAYMLMGTTSGLGQMIQTGGVQRQVQMQQVDYLAGIGTGLGKKMDYFGTPKKNGVVKNGTGLGLGLGSRLGVGKQPNYFGGEKLLLGSTNGKKKVRYY